MESECYPAISMNSATSEASLMPDLIKKEPMSPTEAANPKLSPASTSFLQPVISDLFTPTMTTAASEVGTTTATVGYLVKEEPLDSPGAAASSLPAPPSLVLTTASALTSNPRSANCPVIKSGQHTTTTRLVYPKINVKMETLGDAKCKSTY